jgi:diguanylate cyclase (GGDEF)-like protein
MTVVHILNDRNSSNENSLDANYDEQLGMFDMLGISKNKCEIMIWEADPEMRMFHFYDLPKQDVLSFSYEELENYVHPDNMDFFRHIAQGLLPGKWQSIEQNVQILIKGSWRPFLLKGLLNCIDGKSFVSGVAFDKNSLFQQRQHLEYLESHDVLTGMVNFNSFDAQFEHLSRFGMYPLSLVIIKIENLSDACGSLGYHASNAMIKNVANVIADCFFDADFIGRTGGGEYCSAFTGKDQLEIETRINEAAMKLHSTYLNLIKTEVSFGYSIAEHKKDFCSMYHEAYQKLVRRRNIQKHLSHVSVIDSLNDIISSKVGWGKRVVRLQSLAVQVGKALGCKEDVLAETKLLAKIADIGLIGVNDSLLPIRLQLSENERNAFKDHIEVGREIITGIDSLAQMEGLYMDVFKRYDEWQDAIALPSRIVAAVRGFDNLILKNGSASYRVLRSRLSCCKGKEYCPEVVTLLLDVAKKCLTWPLTDKAL